MLKILDFQIETHASIQYAALVIGFTLNGGLAQQFRYRLNYMERDADIIRGLEKFHEELLTRELTRELTCSTHTHVC